MKVKKAFGMLILAIAVLALAGAAQSSAETAAPAVPTPAVGWLCGEALPDWEQGEGHET